MEFREEVPHLPRHEPDDKLRALPPDVLFLSLNHSFKGHSTWPKPSGSDVNRAIENLPLQYCHNFDRVS